MDLQNLLYKHKTKLMGVINLTPDSFSDGSVNLDSKVLNNNFKLLSESCNILDIGAESTAPFNDAISALDELRRFKDHLFPLLQTISDPCKTISIDTYKPEVFYEVALVINKYWPKSSIIFNDISGQIDCELRYLLKDSLQFDYILCHNLAPNRLEANNHMNYLTDDVVESVSSFFSRHKDLLKSSRAIHADPCFGFSKSYSQNHELVKSLHKIDSLKNYSSIVLGLSRKSFLRIPKKLNFKDNSLEIEQMHSNLLFNLVSKLENNLIIRTHDITPVVSALKSLEILS